MDLKKLFDQIEGGALTYEAFAQALKDNNIKLVDLNEGGYVSKNKYDADINAGNKEIEMLKGTISTRDTDLDALKKQLAEAGTDATKLTDLTSQFETLKGKYDADTKAYQNQLKKQAYEFAVREFAGTKNFSSNAAKRDFIQSMIAKELKMENNSILGADDFVKAYTEENQDAFISDFNYDEEPEADVESKPHFVGSTPGAEDHSNPDPTGGFLSAMHFTPIRPIPNN